MDVLALVLILCAVRQSESASEAKMRELLFAKLNSTEYSPRVRPIGDTGNVMAVNIDMYLVGLNGVDEVEQKITSTAYLQIVWSDTFMTWNPSDYDGIESFTVPQNAIWKPDLALANTYDTVSGLGDSFMQVVVTNDGNITWQPFQVFESTCNLDMTYFPFDTQVCDLQLVTWSSTKSMINIIAGSDGLNIAQYETNANWDLLEASTLDSSTSDTAGLSFRLKIKRKPVYYLVNFIVPIFLLAILNTFVFVLPCDSGEKSGYAMVLFLSFAIFLLIVTETMPEGMNKIPVMSAYLIVECVFSTAIVFITIFQLRLHNQGDATPVPGCLEAFTKGINAMKRKVCCENDTGADNNNDAGFTSVRPKTKGSVDDGMTVNGSGGLPQKRDVSATNGGAPADESEMSELSEAPPQKHRFTTAVRRFVNTIKRDPKVSTETPSERYSDKSDSTQETDVDEHDSARTKRLSEIFKKNKVYPGKFFSKPPSSTLANDKADDNVMDAKPVQTGHYDSRASSPELTPSFPKPVAKSPKDQDDDDAEVTWPVVVLAIDSLLFVVLFVINILTTMIVLIVAATG